MLTNHKLKLIIAYQWERHMVCNFLSHCIGRDEKNGWSVHFLQPNEKPEDVMETAEQK